MTADLAIIGLGYVGLPLAQAAVSSGLSVTGVDVNSDLVSRLCAGQSHIDDISDHQLQAMIESGFLPTSDETALAQATTIVICVPTPLSAQGLPDLHYVVNAADMIARNLARGTLVVLESTTYPGTTEEVVLPILENGSRLTAGVDFNLAFSPERVDPGNAQFAIRNTTKIVGGLTDACTGRAAKFYSQFIDRVVAAKGTREAEMAKLLENTYRHVNIALVNEMARFCHELEIDIWDVVRLAETKPFGFHAFHPGPGVGGHCIPIDPNYLSHRVRSKLGYPFRFVELAQEINATMPWYVAQRAKEILSNREVAMDGAVVLLLGVTYKPNIADQRESPAVHVAANLRKLGATVLFHDPYITDWVVPDAKPIAGPLQSEVHNADLVILLQNHRQYDLDQLIALSNAFFDTRGATTSTLAFRL